MRTDTLRRTAIGFGSMGWQALAQRHMRRFAESAGRVMEQSGLRYTEWRGKGGGRRKSLLAFSEKLINIVIS